MRKGNLIAENEALREKIASLHGENESLQEELHLTKIKMWGFTVGALILSAIVFLFIFLSK